MKQQPDNTFLIIVDDDDLLATSLATIFQIKGYLVTTFNDAESAITFLETGSFPFLIIIDYDLPGMTGSQGMVAFRSLGFEGEMVGISANDCESDMKLAGASSFWSKPIELPGFIDSIQAIEETHHQEAGNEPQPSPN